jgi:hypothetical protein
MNLHLKKKKIWIQGYSEKVPLKIDDIYFTPDYITLGRCYLLHIKSHRMLYSEPSLMKIEKLFTKKIQISFFSISITVSTLFACRHFSLCFESE